MHPLCENNPEFDKKDDQIFEQKEWNRFDWLMHSINSKFPGQTAWNLDRMQTHRMVNPFVSVSFNFYRLK